MNRAERRAAGHRRPSGPRLYLSWMTDAQLTLADGSPAAVLGIGHEDHEPSAVLGLDCTCQVDGLVQDLLEVRRQLVARGVQHRDVPPGGGGRSNSPFVVKK